MAAKRNSDAMIQRQIGNAQRLSAVSDTPAVELLDFLHEAGLILVTDVANLAGESYTQLLSKEFRR